MAAVIGAIRKKAMRVVGKAQRQHDIAIAVEDYSCSHTRGLSFCRGDRFIIDSTSDINWWHVKREDDPRVRGFAPSNFLVKVADLDNLEWINFNTGRENAVDVLERADLPPGSFIIRSTACHINSIHLSLVISVKVDSPTNPVSHFEIRREGDSFRLSMHTFTSLTQLVQHFAVMLGALKKKVVDKSPTQEEIAIALDDYTPADASAGIAFQKNDRFIVKSKTDTNWWHVKREDNRAVKGFAPSNFLLKETDLENYEWITFNIDRERATAQLKNAKNGAFIIRSEATHINSPTLSLSLSVKVQDAPSPVVHYKINRDGASFRIGQSFTTLAALVRHYAGRRKDKTIVLTFSMKKDQSVVPWEYEESAIEKGLRLDRGWFGEVFAGTINGEVVAIKKPDPSRMDPEDYMKEADIARPHKHANLLEIIGICRSQYYIITEFMKNGSLKKFFKKSILSLAECLSVSYKIATALEYLDSVKIVHRDLAARNILVGETIDIIKVCDFGLARSLEESKYYVTRKDVFPRRWTAPECFVKYEGIVNTQEGTITSAADVWSFAVVMWEVYTNGQEPYDRIRDEDLYGMLEAGNRLGHPEKCSASGEVEKCPDVIYSEMLKCWNIDRKARPNFTYLRSLLASLMTDPPTPPSEVRLSHSETTDDDSSVTDSGVYNDPPHEETVPRVEDAESRVTEEIANVEIVEEKAHMVTSPSLFVCPLNNQNDGPLLRPTMMFMPDK